MRANTGEQKSVWVKVGPCLYRYKGATYYALFKVGGKQIRRSLETTDLELARRLVRQLRGELEISSAAREKVSLEEMADRYLKTVRGRPSTVSAPEAEDIANAVIAARNNGLFRNRGDLVSRVLSPTSATQRGVLTDLPKSEREAAIRTLAGIGTTRTWNFLLDLVVQSGQMKVGATSETDFITKAERRVWVHLAIDRLTGEVVDQQWETVHE